MNTKILRLQLLFMRLVLLYLDEIYHAALYGSSESPEVKEHCLKFVTTLEEVYNALGA